MTPILQRGGDERCRSVPPSRPEFQGLILMENAAHRVVEYIAEHFRARFREAANRRESAAKGNNGGDGFAIARILHTPRNGGSDSGSL